MRSRLLAAACLLAAGPGAAEPSHSAAPPDFPAEEVRVVHVVDGDTLTVLTASGRRMRIDIAGVAAPPTGTPAGNRARRVIGQALLNHNVRLVGLHHDGERHVARVMLGAENVGAILARAGILESR